MHLDGGSLKIREQTGIDYPSYQVQCRIVIIHRRDKVISLPGLSYCDLFLWYLYMVLCFVFYLGKRHFSTSYILYSGVCNVHWECKCHVFNMINKGIWIGNLNNEVLSHSAYYQFWAIGHGHTTIKIDWFIDWSLFQSVSEWQSMRSTDAFYSPRFTINWTFYRPQVIGTQSCSLS